MKLSEVIVDLLTVIALSLLVLGLMYAPEIRLWIALNDWSL